MSSFNWGAAACPLLVLIAAAGWVTAVHAQSSAVQSQSSTVQLSAEQLTAGQVDAAITSLEIAADEGKHHPELSFNRGLAYLRRVGTASERASDLGQAAAAFAETLAQRPQDAEAKRGLEESQLAVARRNSRGKSKNGAQVSSPLGLFERALLSLSPQILFILSTMGSVLLSLGLLLRLKHSDTWRLSGRIAVGVGALIFLPCAVLFQSRAAVFADAKMAVVVALQANLLDQGGKKLPGRPPLAESTVVYVKSPHRGLVRLVGALSGEYLSASQLRTVSHGPL